MARPSQPHRRLRVRGRQREDIDIDLLTQALISIAEDQVRQRQGSTAEVTDGSPEQDQ